MRYIINILFIIFLSILTVHATEKKTDFGDYMLALSWSPTYCLNNAEKKDISQCGQKKYKMIVHGLWPQANNPKERLAFCKNSQMHVPAQVTEEIFDIMPSAGLIAHQWRKHGTCSNLSQKAYFAHIRKAYDNVDAESYFDDVTEYQKSSPQKIKDYVISKAPHLTKENIIVTCKGRMLEEIRICLNKELKPSPCKPQDFKRFCRLQEIYIPYY